MQPTTKQLQEYQVRLATDVYRAADDVLVEQPTGSGKTVQIVTLVAMHLGLRFMQAVISAPQQQIEQGFTDRDYGVMAFPDIHGATISPVRRCSSTKPVTPRPMVYRSSSCSGASAADACSPSWPHSIVAMVVRCGSTACLRFAAPWQNAWRKALLQNTSTAKSWRWVGLAFLFPFRTFSISCNVE